MSVIFSFLDSAIEVFIQSHILALRSQFVMILYYYIILRYILSINVTESAQKKLKITANFSTFLPQCCRGEKECIIRG